MFSKILAQIRLRQTSRLLWNLSGEQDGVARKPRFFTADIQDGRRFFHLLQNKQVKLHNVISIL